MQVLQRPMEPAAFKTLRDYLPACAQNQALVFESTANAVKNIFYFPGCGSERMFSDISLAAIYVMLKSGMRVILPPPNICCGFPVEANGKTTLHNKMVLRDTIILNQIHDMFRHLSFDAVAVTCGTCKEALENMGICDVFSAPIQDVMLLTSPVIQGAERVLYHKPCHDSLEDKGIACIKKILQSQAGVVPHCCSEAGTLALSRPDITGAMQHKKQEAYHAVSGIFPEAGILLTNCPSCIQGLGKIYPRSTEIKHLAVYSAETMGGKDWKRELKTMIMHFERVNF